MKEGWCDGCLIVHVRVLWIKAMGTSARVTARQMGKDDIHPLATGSVGDIINGVLCYFGPKHRIGRCASRSEG